MLALLLLGFRVRLVHESLLILVQVPLVLLEKFLFATLILTTSDKDDKESPSLGKGRFSKSFQEMISLITGFFPHSKPSVTSTLDKLIPRLDVIGNTCSCSPRVFLNLFDKLLAISEEVEVKFSKVADDKKAPSALPHWGEVYHIGDLEKFYKAPKINESFSLLLNKPVSTSRYVSLSLDDSAKLESCIHGQIESQSFSLWALAAIFEFLNESNCVPDIAVFQ